MILRIRRGKTRVFTSSVFLFFAVSMGIAMMFGASRTAVAGAILDDPILDQPILGGRLLVANDGDVTAKFLGSDAGYFNSLFLVGFDDPIFIFDKSSQLNSSINLGAFSAGTELIFRLDVSNTGRSFFSGDLIRNPDLLAHVEAITTTLENTYVTTVGFEDLFGGGDKDYNDFMFQLTNVIDPPPGVPEPSALALFVIGLAGIGYHWRKHKKAT